MFPPYPPALILRTVGRLYARHMSERLSDPRAIAEQVVAEARRAVESQSQLLATYERR
jgi:hypothetical protein